MFKRSSLNFAILALLLDAVLTLSAMVAAVALRQVLPYGPDLDRSALIHDPVYVAAVLIWILVAIILSVYDPRRTLRAADEFQQVLLALIVSAFCLSGFVFFSFKDMSRYLFLYFFAIDAALLLGWRILYRIVRRLGNGRLMPPRHVLIIGAGEVGRLTAETLSENAWMGFHPIGFTDDDPAKQHGLITGFPVLGTVAETVDIVHKHAVDEIVIALPLSAYEKVVQLSLELQRYPVTVRVVPDYFNLALFRAAVEELGGMPLINLRAPALNDYQRLIKRCFDLMVGTLALIMTLPLMGIIGLLIKLDSPGKIIFHQQRVGENGRLFWMYKFRTMIDGAEAYLSAVLRQDETGHILFKTPNDPRITHLGRFLRHTSLDELPQLFNVLKGDMSLVGPRPELPWLVERYEPWQCKRFAVPQGMTGWWQVNGRSSKPLHLHTEDDLYYIQNYSLLLDIQILWKTIWVVIRRKGAF
ncbi:undecaprenyl-phosphate galactose phosphotransferase [Thermoflexales bacterium]|nr:undecaprenyl-phosphate galactose phosphotransferase [Thermoflexales bacterium]